MKLARRDKIILIITIIATILLYSIGPVYNTLTHDTESEKENLRLNSE
jgi:hypothetical protein